MTDLTRVQATLRERGLDAWILFDYRGSNQYFLELFGKCFTTRRVFIFVYAGRHPEALVHYVDAGQLPPELSRRIYIGRKEMLEGLRELCRDMKSVAMEYSPMGELPTASYVDGGTLDLMRSLGLDVVSSAELYQQAFTVWSAEQLASHRRVAAHLTRIVQEAFVFAGERLGTATELDVHRFVRERFEDAGIWAEDGPIVAVNAHAGDPHYHPQENGSSVIRQGDWALIDLWATEPDSVYADITWVGYAGERVPEQQQAVFDVVRGARDAAVEFLRARARTGEPAYGFEVDDCARRYIAERGFGDKFTHRLGHSIGFRVHGNGVNMDNLETHDVRPVVPGCCFSIEPGIYLPDFGVRSEIDVFMHESGPEVTTPPQTAVFLFG